jgi:hypothetical protein
LISKFEEIKMLEDETFGEFYSKMSDLRNSMVSLGKPISGVKLIWKILRSLPERFRIKVTTIEESKDLKEMKIEELVGSLQTYELSLPPVKKLKTIALKASKKKVEASSEDDFEDEEKAVAMLAKNFRRLMKDDRFKKKFSEKVKKPPREAEPEEEEKKDPKGPWCFECSGFGHIQADCGNLKKGKRKAYNVTLSDESEEKALESEKFLAFVAPLIEEEDSYYSEHSDNGEEVKEAYKTLYIEYEKLREGRKQHLYDLNNLQTEKSSLLLRIQELEEKLLETQLQLERVTDEKLTRMLSIQKSPTDKTGLGYVASSYDAPSTLKTVFVKPAVPEPAPTTEDKEKDKLNDDVPGTQKPHSIRRAPICHHCGLSGHVRPQCSLLKAQKAKAKKEVPQQANNGTRFAAQHQTPWHQAPYQAPWGQAPRHQYQAPWSHALRVQASQHQRPQQRFVPANHSGNFKNKSRQFRRPQKVEEGQYHSEPPIWMQSMMEWMMQSYQQSPTGRQAWVKKDSHPMRGNRRT